MKLSDLQIVLIDSPYETWDNKETQDLFFKTVDLKLKGYLNDYEHGVLPLDTTDFVGTHHLICQKTPTGLVPLLGWRSISLEKAKLHNMPFSPLALARACNSPDHEKAIQAIVDRAEKEKFSITYESAITIHPSVRNNEEVTSLLKDVLRAMHVHHHHDYNIKESIVGGSMRHKMDRYFLWWGYKAIDLNGKTLPFVKVPQAKFEPTIIYYRKEFSKEALELAPKFRAIWDEKIVISSEREGAKRKAG